MSEKLLVSRNEQALALRAEADKLRAKMADPAERMTVDEVVKTKDDIVSLETRAAAVAEFTPEAEINRQGGDAEALRRAPGAEDPTNRTSDATVRVRALRKEGDKVFGNLGEFLKAIGTRTEPVRLNEAQRAYLERVKAETRTIVGASGDTSGGEFLLPLQQVPEIFRAPNVLNGIIDAARRYNISGRTLRIPYVKQSETAASGVAYRPLAGIVAVSIVDEAATKPVLEPTFGQRLLTAYKWAGRSAIADETLGDDFTGDLPPVLIDQVGGEILNAINDSCTASGTGTGQPLGATHANNAAKLDTARAGANAIAAADIFKMYAFHTIGPKSRWLVSRSAFEKLLALTLGSNTLVSFLPNLRDNPSGFMLLGLPVFVSDSMPALGTVGDLCLVNPDYYAFAMRTQLTVESSIHAMFFQDVTAWRFYARAGGIPIPDGTYAYKATGGTKLDPHSPFVRLAA